MMLTPTDISKILRVSSSHVALLSKGFLKDEDDITKIGKRSYYSPAITKKILSSRGVDFKRKEIIAFCNNKGGVGKTSLSVNTALRLSAMGFKTLLIDADSQASATSHILGNTKLEVTNNLIDVVSGKATISESVVQVSQTLDLLPSSLKNSMLDMEIVAKSGRSNAATYFSEKLKEQDYNYIIWDLSPTITTSLYWILLSCTKLVIVTNLEEFAVQGAEMTIDIVNELKGAHPAFNPDSKILINRFDERNKSLLNYLSRLDKLKEKGVSTYQTVIKVDTNVQKSQSSQSMLPHNTQSFTDLSDFIFELSDLSTRELSN